MAQVFLGMSGGVDSSAAAVLLQAQGYAVSGLHLSLLSGLPLPADRLPDDGSDARAVASLLGLPFYDMDLSPEFRATVIDYFIREYETGRTPNPCVFCNRWIKFGTMWDAAQKLGADYLATGHYAKIRQDPATGRHLLCRGADRSKDQSYFLCRLTQEQLSRTLFPLGDLEKPAVRALAEAHGLINAQKRDSQDICFVPDGDYVSFHYPLRGTRIPHRAVCRPGGPRLRPAQGVHPLHQGAAQGTGSCHRTAAVRPAEGPGGPCRLSGSQ